ncbi:hypothetical protein ABZP36_031674 [Zizania latifolia]
MGNHETLLVAKCLFTLTISFFGMVVADPAQASQHSLSYHPQPQEFPNGRLYHAYLVIQRFKNTITSDPKNVTATWTGSDICGDSAYIGFYCWALPGRGGNELTVTEVFLNGFGLRAPKLEGFVDKLPDLAFFHAASNYFGGDIPYLDSLGYLYKLNVAQDTQYRTTVWSAGTHTDAVVVTPCTKATLRFSFNVTTPDMKGWGKGHIPGVTDAKALLLNYNNLVGQLPANIGFSKLSYLALANNKLTGPIPSSISNLQDSLFEVLLLNNQLSGCLPQELGMLTKATVIDAGMNQLTGHIPSSFSCLASVEQLNLAENRLYGDIPNALCKLAAGGHLANLTLSGNYFTSVGPACSSLIKDGVLNVKNNCIPGLANQRRPAECAAFLSQPKTCPAASATHAACPAAAAAPVSRVAKDYSSYVTYATLHK